MTTAIIESAADVNEPRGDSIDTWLAVLVRLLDISSAKRDAIRDEIEAHLRERVRDLMIAGTPEHDAIAAAISELGEVADLARRFSHASKLRTRRIIMNAAVLAVGGVSVAMATVFLNAPQPTSHVAIYQATPPAAKTTESSILEDRTAQVHFADVAIGDVFKFLAEQAGLDLVVDTRAIENQGLSMEEPVSLELTKSRSVSQILELISHQFETTFAWRVHDHILEISTPEQFDRRDVMLSAFDVQDVLDRIYEDTGDSDEAATRLESLVIDYVEPASWNSNGGDLASLRIVGGKMFVKAPSRFQQPIEWIIAQLEESAASHAARSNPLGGSTGGGALGFVPSVQPGRPNPLSGGSGWNLVPTPYSTTAPSAPGGINPALPSTNGAASPVSPFESGAPTTPAPSSIDGLTTPSSLPHPGSPDNPVFAPATGGGGSSAGDATSNPLSGTSSSSGSGSSTGTPGSH